MSKNDYCKFVDFLFTQNNTNFTNTMTIPAKLGKSKIIETKIDENIFLLKSDIQPNQNMQFNTSSVVNGLYLYFHLKGDLKYKSSLSKYEITHKNNFRTASILNNEKGVHNLQKDSNIKNLAIIIKKEFLEQNIPNITDNKIFKSLEDKNCALLLNQERTDSLTNILVKELYETKYQGSLERIFIHSKVLEILFIELNNIFGKNTDSIKDDKIIFDNYDIEAIKESKKILLDNIQNPPSIIELAKYVKLNEFKLKVGFKKLFKTTPYKLLYNHRMLIAKKLLETSDMNVTQIANEVGYKYVHNFSKVFLKKFNISPKKLILQRKDIF